MPAGQRLAALATTLNLIGAPSPSSAFAGTRLARRSAAGCALASPSFVNFCAFGLASTARAMSSSPSASADPSLRLTVAQVPCLSDNYGYLIHDEATGDTAAVDTPEAGPYRKELERRGWTLTHILNTHHHYDHTGANLELKGKGVTSELDFCHCFVFYFPLLNGCHGSVHVVTLIIRGFDALPFSPTSPPSYPQIDQLSDR